MSESQKRSTISIPPMPDNRVTAPSIDSPFVCPNLAFSKLVSNERLTLGEYVEQENEKWGFKGEGTPPVDIEHEVSHLFLQCSGIQKYNGFLIPEYFVLALESAIMWGECNAKKFAEEVRYYEKEFYSPELKNRTLLHMMRHHVPENEGGHPDLASLWRESHYFQPTLIKKLKEIMPEFQDHPARIGRGWTISNGKETYCYNPYKSEKTVLPDECDTFSLPNSPADEEIDRLFDRIKPGLDLLKEEVIDPSKNVQGYINVPTLRSNLKKYPVKKLMDALGTEKLMVHQVGEGAQGEKLDVKQGAADLKKAKDWQEHIEKKPVKERVAAR